MHIHQTTTEAKAWVRMLDCCEDAADVCRTDAVYALSRRVEELEADLARRNAEALASPESDKTRRNAETLASPESDTTRAEKSRTDTETKERVASRAEIDSSSSSGDVLDLQLGQNWYFRGMKILSEKGQQWLQSKTGQKAPLKRFVAFDGIQRYASPQVNRDFRTLPDRHATNAAIDAFVKHSVHPVLDLTLMDATVEEAYCRQSLPAQACVWALHTWSFPPSSNVEAAAEAAVQSRSLLERIGWEASLDALQAILLVSSRPFQNSWEASWMHFKRYCWSFNVHPQTALTETVISTSVFQRWITVCCCTYGL